MPMQYSFTETEPSRAEIDALAGPVLVEFGTSWCGHCQGAQPLIEAAMASDQQVHHLKIEDGPGRPLGRSFRVKLWPTLVFLRNGQELSRLVRPADSAPITRAIADITAA